MTKPLPLALALLSLLALIIAASTAAADVVRPAPEFTWAGGKAASLRTLRGQPVVLIIAPSAKSHAFRKQVKRLQAEYTPLAARATVFAAAFTGEAASDDVIPSNIPFVIVNNGAAVAARYGVTGSFGLMVIGKDGNLDLQTAKVSPASVVRDAILNNADLQAAERR